VSECEDIRTIGVIENDVSGRRSEFECFPLSCRMRIVERRWGISTNGPSCNL
jgi:hypothetical protein